MEIILKTNWGFEMPVEMPAVPRIGESIIVSDLTELYNDKCGQSPRWIVTDVVYYLEKVVSHMTNNDAVLYYPVEVHIKNEED